MKKIIIDLGRSIPCWDTMTRERKPQSDLPRYGVFSISQTTNEREFIETSNNLKELKEKYGDGNIEIVKWHKRELVKKGGQNDDEGGVSGIGRILAIRNSHNHKGKGGHDSKIRRG